MSSPSPIGAFALSQKWAAWFCLLWLFIIQVAGKKSRHMYSGNEYNGVITTGPQPQSQGFFFQSSTVSYGGANGTYYTSSRTRRSGSDGVSIWIVD